MRSWRYDPLCLRRLHYRCCLSLLPPPAARSVESAYPLAASAAPPSLRSAAAFHPFSALLPPPAALHAVAKHASAGEGKKKDEAVPSLPTLQLVSPSCAATRHRSCSRIHPAPLHPSPPSSPPMRGRRSDRGKMCERRTTHVWLSLLVLCALHFLFVFTLFLFSFCSFVLLLFFVRSSISFPPTHLRVSASLPLLLFPRASASLLPLPSFSLSPLPSRPFPGEQHVDRARHVPTASQPAEGRRARDAVWR